MTPGWLLTDWGRRRTFPRYRPMSALNRSIVDGASASAVADANRIFPASMSASMPSWITSVYTSISPNSESSSPYRTALATLPKPDCRG